MRRMSGLVLGLALGCTPRQEAPEPEPPSVEPTIVAEVEPGPAKPAIVAPKLPPLVPSRPLANIGLIWHQDPEVDPAHDAMWTIGTGVLGVDADTAALLGLSGPTDDLSLVIPHVDEVIRAGPLLVSHWGRFFVTYEAGTDGVRWETPERDDARCYVYATDERVLLASFIGNTGSSLSAWALEDGRRLWTRESDKDGDFAGVRRILSDGERGYFLGSDVVEAFDPLTGATKWRTPLAGPDCGFELGEGVLIVEDPEGARILDPEFGTERGRIGPKPGRCLWSDYVRAEATISAGRFLVFDATGIGKFDQPTILRAYDLETQAELWSAEGYYSETLRADQDAVYVLRDTDFIALDAATGTEVYEHGIGSWFTIRVEPVGGAFGPLVLIEDYELDGWVFGRLDQPTPVESWEIRGQLVSDGYLDDKQLRKVEISVNGQIVQTDAKGRFVARGEGRGMVMIESDDDYGYGSDGYTHVEFEVERVELDGSGSYDIGKIEAYEGYVE